MPSRSSCLPSRPGAETSGIATCALNQSVVKKVSISCGSPVQRRNIHHNVQCPSQPHRKAHQYGPSLRFALEKEAACFAWLNHANRRICLTIPPERGCLIGCLNTHHLRRIPDAATTRKGITSFSMFKIPRRYKNPAGILHSHFSLLPYVSRESEFHFHSHCPFLFSQPPFPLIYD